MLRIVEQYSRIIDFRIELIRKSKVCWDLKYLVGSYNNQSRKLEPDPNVRQVSMHLGSNVLHALLVVVLAKALPSVQSAKVPQ